MITFSFIYSSYIQKQANACICILIENHGSCPLCTQKNEQERERRRRRVLFKYNYDIRVCSSIDILSFDSIVSDFMHIIIIVYDWWEFEKKGLLSCLNLSFSFSVSCDYVLISTQIRTNNYNTKRSELIDSSPSNQYLILRRKKEKNCAK